MDDQNTVTDEHVLEMIKNAAQMHEDGENHHTAALFRMAESRIAFLEAQVTNARAILSVRQFTSE